MASKTYVNYGSDLLVSEAKQLYYNSNNLPSDGGKTERWAYGYFGGLRLRAFPNSRARMAAIKRHDLHHLITDCDTSSTGEAIVAAWELGAGYSKYWLGWWQGLQAFTLGALLLAPMKCFKQFIIGRHSKTFYREKIDDTWEGKKLEALRICMLPSDTNQIKTSLKDVLLFAAYTVAGIFTTLVSLPIYLFFIIAGVIVGEKTESETN